MKSCLARVAVAAIAGVAACAAHSAGENAAMKDTPASKFTADDFALMNQRVKQALDAPNEGEKLEWRNEKTGASGSVTPMNRLTWNGMSCRRLQIANKAGAASGQGIYKFCQKTPGAWKLVGPD